MERLNGPPIGVTAAQLFVVDTHAILMVSSDKKQHGQVMVMISIYVDNVSEIRL